jgi:flavin-dependent dehydrogenase
MCLVFGPKDYFPHFRRNHEESYFHLIELISSELGETMRQARREEKFYGIADQRGLKRQSAGPGWLLTGDAACLKDQCTAIGMTHAFRDAELAAEAIASPDEPRAFAEYARRREEDLGSYYDFVCRSAAMAPASPDDLALMAGLAARREWADAFAAMYGDALRLDEFAAQVRPLAMAFGRSISTGLDPLPVHAYNA